MTRQRKPLDRKRAWNYTLWLLGRRAYTEHELRERLARRDADPAVIKETLERLESYGFIDDASFAEVFVRSRKSRHGPIRLRQDLRRRGVAAALISEALQELDEESQLKTALQILRKHAWRFERDEDSRRKRNRAFGFLARRGFPAAAASGAVEAFLADDAES